LLSNKSLTAKPNGMAAMVEWRETLSPMDKTTESATSLNIHTLPLLDLANTQAVTLESESLPSLTLNLEANLLFKLL